MKVIFTIVYFTFTIIPLPAQKAEFSATQDFSSEVNFEFVTDSIRSQSWIDNTWEDDYKFILRHDNRGNEIEQIFVDRFQGEWINLSTKICSFDIDDNWLGCEYFLWNDTTNTWRIYLRNSLSYDSNGKMDYCYCSSEVRNNNEDYQDLIK